MTLHEGTPRQAGLREDRLELLDETVEGWLGAGLYHGLSVVAARNGVVALHRAYGAFPDGRPLTTEAVFAIASVSKPLIAATVLSLVEEGRLETTEPVRDIVPEFDGRGRWRVCVHHLLTHTSGLRGPNAMDPRPWKDQVDRAQPLSGQLLELVYEWPLTTRPGEVMCYEPANYDLLAEIVRRVTGNSLHQEMQRRVFGPVGMANSWVGLPEDRRRDLLVDHPYLDPLPPSDDPLAERRVCGGNDRVCSTAADLARFVQMLLDGGVVDGTRVLSPTSVEEMTTNQIPGVPGVAPRIREEHAEAGWSFGFGIVDHERWWQQPRPAVGAFLHSGAGVSTAWGEPRSGVVGAVLTLPTMGSEERTRAMLRGTAGSAIAPHSRLVSVISNAVTD